VPAPPAFTFAEASPDPRLTPWVSRYWEFRVHPGAPARHRVPPDGCTSLVVASGPGRVPVLVASGPWLEPLAIPVSPGDRFVGVRLQPGAAGSFLGVDPLLRCNVAAPVTTVSGHPAGDLARRLEATSTLAAAAAVMNRTFLSVTAGLAMPDPLVGAAAAALVASRGADRITAVASRLSVSPRTLLRRFRAGTGLTPKQYARVVRFRLAAITLLADPLRLSRVAAAGGYADQPHLTREWARLLAITPRQLAEVVRLTAHEGLAP